MSLWFSSSKVVLRCSSIALLIAVTTISASAHSSPTSSGINLPSITPTVDCSELGNTDLTAIGGAGSAISTAEVKQETCVVKGILAPQIGFEVHLPLKSWTQRYLQVGCGGLCGNISLNVGAADGCLPVTGGEFVIASTDMGHSGMSGDFGQAPQKQIDFAYRGVHVTAQAAKALIKTFYGQAQKYAYFTGCSDGGREALIEAQRYPDDFDGILAGAPAMNFSVQNSFYHSWQATANTGKDGKAILHAKDMPVLYKAALAQCDALDGLQDGLISDPRVCHFDPIVTQCKAGQNTECLSAEQVATARKLYRGPHDTKTGTSLTLGGPQPGSELSWVGVYVPRPGSEMIFSKMIAEDALRYLVFEQNPAASYQVSELKYDLASFDKIRVKNQLFNGTNPDLNAFNQAGGKLIMWHGWSDPHISPLNTIAYYQAVNELMGSQQAEFMQLYLFPGMYHCDDGTGPHDVDLLSPMMAWVEQGRAPEKIITTHPGNAAKDKKPTMGAPGKMPPLNGKPADLGEDKGHKMGPPELAMNKTTFTVDYIKRSRPVYPYPYLASYVGEGDVNDASNFKAQLNSSGHLDHPWAGEQFFTAGQQAPCAVQSSAVVCPPLSTEGK